MDEKGFLMGVIKKLKVVIPRYEEKKHITQPGNREWVSIIECISTDGRKLEPWVIFKAKQLQKAWYECEYNGHIATSENGWTDNWIGLQWLEHCFEKETSNQKGEYRMLILDGHASHVTTAAIQFCVDHKILLLCLPAHTTHILQPLDVGIFAPLSIIYSNHIQRKSRLGATYSIDKVDFLETYQRSREEAITSANIISAWAKVGLNPYDPMRILKDYPEKDVIENAEYNYQHQTYYTK